MTPQPGKCPAGRRGRDLSTPHPRAASLLSLPAFSRALFHINSSAGCKVSEPGEKLFKRDPADRHLFTTEGSWEGGGRLLLLAAIGSSVQQMWIVFTPWHTRKKCRSKRDSELVKVTHGFVLL